MDTKSYTKRVSLNNTYKINNLIENICQEYNISYYYGIISVSIEHVLDLVMSFYSNTVAKEEIVFCFEQCVGGVSFSIECKDEIFSSMVFDRNKEIEDLDVNAFLISKLSDKVIVLEEGRKLELLFFVNGIEPELLLDRQEKIKEYNSSRMHQNIN